MKNDYLLQSLWKHYVKRHIFLNVDAFSTFRYQEDPDLLHESQLDLLCELIDFIWEKTALLTDNAERVDMRLTLTDNQLGRVS